MVKKDASSPKRGMNRDTHPGELTKEEYSFALNANFHNENGNGKVMLQNENSNIKCSGFKAGYKVVGHKYDLVTERTYFFLTNPTTGYSEIGTISSIPQAFSLTPTETTDANGNIRVVLETPLEETTQTAYCEYQTLLSDECEGSNKCLNFSITDPFHENNIHIKHGKRGTTLWFTHKRNPQRYIQLDNLGIYTEDVNPCDDSTTQTCLDCEKMRVFPLYEKPCLTVKGITTGGMLRAGNYEIAIAYSDIFGVELTDYSPLTNPVRIFDKNNNVLDQTLLDYLTNQAIVVGIDNLDLDFDFIKVTVVYTEGLEGSKRAFEFGVFPTSIDEITIFEIQNKEEVTLQALLNRRPFYTSARGSAVSNGYLYYHGLTTQRTVNLQPVVNLLGAFAEWNTFIAKEKLFEDGAAMALYGGYMRNEVYPFAIEFTMDGGYTTARFPLIARPPQPSEVQVIDTIEVDSVNEYNPACFGNDRVYRWQYENTAQETGECLIPAGEIPGTEFQREVEASCTVLDDEGQPEVVDTVTSGTIIVPYNVPNIVDYINANRDAIIASTGPNGEEIRDVLEDPTQYPLAVCTPDFQSNCSEVLELVSEGMFAISAETQEIEETELPIDVSSYPPIPAPAQACQIYELDNSGNLVEDTSFESTYMLGSENVYKRQNPLNTQCGTATEPLLYTSPAPTSNFHLQYKGEESTVATLVSSINSDATQQILKITLAGTSGSATININGTGYLAPYAGTSINDTLLNFVALHGPTIGGLTPTVSGNTITLVGPATTFYQTTITNVSGDLNGSFDNSFFTNKLHTNAIWFKVTFNGETKKIFQIGSNLCVNPDDISTSSVRLSVYSGCPSPALVAGDSRIISDLGATDVNKIVELNASDFSGGVAYIAMDTPIRSRRESSGSKTLNILPVPCGCFNAYQVAVKRQFVVTYTNLTFGKEQTYKSLCTFVIPDLTNCDALPYKRGSFGYWESTNLYPCNRELYDSSRLQIRPVDIPNSIRNDFEMYFTNGTINGIYDLTTDTDFRDKPIRHYKFPDNTVAPFMSDYGQAPTPFQESVIYPIGFNLSPTLIGAFLDIAVKNGLLTPEERSKITSYQIYRGDRRIHKSIIAKGLLFDMYKYEQQISGNTETIHYPNYPLNSLGLDRFNGLVQHPGGNSGASSLANNFFTFHSPDTDYYRPSLPRELYVEGYLMGHSANYFDEVEDFPKYVVLGQRSYTLADSLALAETALEGLVQTGTWTINAAAGGLSAPAAALVAVAALAITIPAMLFKYGEYRYKWLEIIRNFGKLDNLAYYQASVGYYNAFLPNTIPFQKRRGLSVSTYLKDGMKEVAEESTGSQLKINALDREWTVALRTGNYDINYHPTYAGYDIVGNSNDGDASRRRAPEVKGKSGVIVGRAASPYASLIQYNPGQWGQVESISWVNTGFCGNLVSTTDCDAVFGGDIFISRHSLKRKLPFFRNNAFGLGANTPFKHSDYFNINPPDPTLSSTQIVNRYFLDFEVNDSDANFTSILLFPGNRSYYNLDNGGNSINEFYVKAPQKFYLYSYGIPHFLVESEINCNFRYAKREKFENFYPNISDPIEFTQQKNVSIREPNTFFYNSVYSFAPTLQSGLVLPINFEQAIADRLNDLVNAIIYSQQDLSERTNREPWRNFKSGDFFEFSKSNGRIIAVNGIESLQIIVRAENGFTIYGSIDQLRDRLTPEVGNLGSGGIFAGRPINFNTTQLGHAGTQHNAFVSCEFGHFWVDAMRGKVFMLGPNGKELREVSKSQSTINGSLEKWFKENLPFKIKRTFPNVNIDNNFLGIGIAMVWDERFKRLIITKHDVIPQNLENIDEHNGSLYDESTKNQIIEDTEALGWTYVEQIDENLYFEREGGQDECACITLTYAFKSQPEVSLFLDKSGITNGRANFFFTTEGVSYRIFWTGSRWEMRTIVGDNLIGFLEENQLCPDGRWDFLQITNLEALSSIACDPSEHQTERETLVIPLPLADLTDTDLFKPCSWTVAYNPQLDSWISYYSYLPNYYIGYNEYFQSGVNRDGDEFGLWSHLPFISSYQVFYGKKYPFIVEFPVTTQLVNSQLSAIEYWLDVRKYYDEHNFTDIYGRGFNKAVVYNAFQNTGMLHLVHHDKNNLRQAIEYPKYLPTHTEVLQTEINGRWTFNYLYNAIKEERAGLPIWKEDCPQIEKTLDNRLLNYLPSYKDYLRGDYFLVRLIQDADTRFKLLVRWITNSRDYYED